MHLGIQYLDNLLYTTLKINKPNQLPEFFCPRASIQKLNKSAQKYKKEQTLN